MQRIRWLEDLITRHDTNLDIRSIATNTHVTLDVMRESSESYITDPPKRIQNGQSENPAVTTAEADFIRLSFPEKLEPKGNLFLDPSLESGDAYIPPTAPSTYGMFARKHTLFEDDDPVSTPSKILASTIRANSKLGTKPPPKPIYPPIETAKSFCDAYFYHNHTQAPFLHHASFRRFFIQFYSTDFMEAQPSWLFILNM